MMDSGEDTEQAAKEDLKEAKIILIGRGDGLSASLIASTSRTADVVVFDSVEEFERSEYGPAPVLISGGNVGCLIEPETATKYSMQKFNRGKGRGRGAADWNRKTRGY